MDKGPAKLFRSTNESLGDAPDIFFRVGDPREPESQQVAELLDLLPHEGRKTHRAIDWRRSRPRRVDQPISILLDIPDLCRSRCAPPPPI